MTSLDVLQHVDHLIYATSDLSAGVAEIEELLGIRASLGGRHAPWGTHNALVALGPMSYLEIIAPDVDQTPSQRGRPFGLDQPGPSRLVAWAAKAMGLELIRDQASRNGTELGKVQTGSRLRPDGVLLTWQLTDLRCVVADGIVPFLIDWGQSPHPALVASPGATLVGLSAEHPCPVHATRSLHDLGLALPVVAGPVPSLIAEIDSRNGRVVLR